MRRILIVATLIASFLSSSPSNAGGKKGGGNVSVRGYTRSNGTYVRPHMRSAPDGNFGNNWSTFGNINPYTGVLGTKRRPRQTGEQHFAGSPERIDLGVPDSEVAKAGPQASSAENGEASGLEANLPNPDVSPSKSDLVRIEKANAEAAFSSSERGYAYYLKQDYDNAIEEYTKAIELNKSEHVFYSNRGMIYLRIGAIDHAIEDFNRAIRMNSLHRQAHLGLGEAYRRKGEWLGQHGVR